MATYLAGQPAQPSPPRHLPPGAAIAVVAGVAVVSPVPSAAQSALLARVLTGELYVLGRSVFNVTSSGAQLAGLAIGGTVVTAIGAHTTIAIAAGVQLLGLCAVTALPQTDRTPTPGRWHPAETTPADITTGPEDPHRWKM